MVKSSSEKWNSFFSRAYDNQAPDNYQLGENDELTISIWGLAEHSESLQLVKVGILILVLQDVFM